MKRVIIISVVIYTLLGFGLGSIPFSNINKSEGSMLVEYGLPLRWLTVDRRLAGDKGRSASMQWWKTDKRSFKISGFVCDAAIAALAGVVLTVLTVRVRQWKVRREGVSS